MRYDIVLGGDAQVPVSDEIIELEENGTSATAYENLFARWRAGERDRERALHLLFLAWDLMMEPPHLTGRKHETRDAELIPVFEEAHRSLLPEGEWGSDVEALYVVGLVAHLARWLLGPHDEWEARSGAYQRRYREVLGRPISPEVFRDARGSYGRYFRRQAAVEGGY